jgi:predicted transcriptional regulator
MPYTTEEIIEPFWAEYVGEAGGRDPLGIQNSSVVIYTKLIQGVTNVTNRIRYNGFYCWLMDSILKDDRLKHKTDLEDQIKYIRRGELLLAFLMVKKFPLEAGVSGSLYANRKKDDNLSLKIGADWENRKQAGGVYWKYHNGAFGQYFTGVLYALGLVNAPQGEMLNIYSLTNKGRELAIAYRQTISEEAESLFIDCVFKGISNNNNFELLASFAVNNIPVNSSEHVFYQEMMLSDDGQTKPATFYRRDTIKLILNLLKEENSTIDNIPLGFLKDNYQNTFTQKVLDLESTSTGWYYYEVNELLHVAYEHLHSALLYFIDIYPRALDEVLDSILDEALNLFDNSPLLLNDHIESLGNYNVYEYYDGMLLAFKNNLFGECIVNAINVIVSVYKNNLHHWDTLKVYSSKIENNFNRNGYANEIIELFIESKKDLTMEEYLRTLLITTINQHMFISYTKSNIGQGLVHNYIIEDDQIWRLRDTLPGRTSPRIQNLLQYIADLGWVAKDGKTYKITELGTEILNKI